MLSPYRNSSNTNHTRKQKNSNTNHDDVKMTSNDLKRTQMTSKDTDVKPVKSKNKMKSVANIEINDKSLDESFRKNNPQLDLAMQIISNDQTVRSDTAQDFKKFNSHRIGDSNWIKKWFFRWLNLKNFSNLVLGDFPYFSLLF